MNTAETRTRLLTIEEAAKRLNVSRATAYRMVYDGRLPTLQLGGRGSALRVDEAELERWLRADPEDA
jgi:excisionase family DNA binding protein